MKKILLMLLFMPAICSAVDQPAFTTKDQILRLPSVLIDGIPSSAVIYLPENGVIKVLEIKKLENCPLNGAAGFSPINLNCGV